MKNLGLAPIVVLGALSAGCISGSPPHDKVASSEADVEMADADAEVARAAARERQARIALQQAKERAQALRSRLSGSAIGGGPLQSPNDTAVPAPIQPSGPIAPPAQAPAQPHP